jgi:TAT (twin-arginine translocation) pathway signal sequence
MKNRGLKLMKNMSRRDFLATSLLTGASTLLAGDKTPPKPQEFVPPMIAFPQKKPLKTISDRPPLLESARDIFTKEITPNDEFFVRWTCLISRHILTLLHLG